MRKENYQEVTGDVFESIVAAYPFMGDILRDSTDEDPVYFADRSKTVCPENLRHKPEDQVEEVVLFNARTLEGKTVYVHRESSLDDERIVSVKRAARESGIAPDYAVVERSEVVSMGEGTFMVLYQIPADWSGGTA